MNHLVLLNCIDTADLVTDTQIILTVEVTDMHPKHTAAVNLLTYPNLTDTLSLLTDNIFADTKGY